MSDVSPPTVREPIPVAVLGATGSVGQRFVSLLERHPWFELVSVMASPRSVGRPYGAAVDWMLPTPCPGAAAALEVGPCEPARPPRLVFSALGTSVAREVEPAFADAGCLVVSNAAAHRMRPDVPLLVPEVNADHVALDLAPDLEPGAGGHRGASGGRLLANPNCSTIGLVLALKPLHDRFGVKAVHVVTLQALSGAGLPGVPALAATDNIVPYIPDEEDKLGSETAKILGTLGETGIAPATVTVSAQCNRVPVVDGHTLCVSVGLETPADSASLRAAWDEYRAPPDVAALPSAPRRPVHVLDAEDAPQPRLHRDLEGGMAVAVGRLRACPLLDQRFVALSHNTIRGAAGGALLVAELAVARGLLPGA